MSKNFKIIIFDSELGSIRTEQFFQLTDKHLETKTGLYDLSLTKKYYNETDGLVYYIVNADLPARTEANNLKRLRRSVALNNIFNYDVKKAFDIVAFMPWLIIVMLIIFM